MSGSGTMATSQVTATSFWAFGHLVQLAMPEAYGYTGFRRENLPILPQEFKYIPARYGRARSTSPIPACSNS